MINAQHIDEGWRGIEKVLLRWELENGSIADKICDGECINCERRYKGDLQIIYATTSQGKVVWWCEGRCKGHKHD